MLASPFLALDSSLADVHSRLFFSLSFLYPPTYVCRSIRLCSGSKGRLRFAYLLIWSEFYRILRTNHLSSPRFDWLSIGIGIVVAQARINRLSSAYERWTTVAFSIGTQAMENSGFFDWYTSSHLLHLILKLHLMNAWIFYFLTLTGRMYLFPSILPWNFNTLPWLII
jgi:hypothetical protein